MLNVRLPQTDHRSVPLVNGSTCPCLWPFDIHGDLHDLLRQLHVVHLGLFPLCWELYISQRLDLIVLAPCTVGRLVPPGSRVFFSSCCGRILLHPSSLPALISLDPSTHTASISLRRQFDLLQFYCVYLFAPNKFSVRLLARHTTGPLNQ